MPHCSLLKAIRPKEPTSVAISSSPGFFLVMSVIGLALLPCGSVLAVVTLYLFLLLPL
jgi:hypothetical protein